LRPAPLAIDAALFYNALMTTYSKICPKCQTPCDLAASSCKRCGLKFGAPATEAASKSAESSSGFGRIAIVLAVLGLLAVVVAFQVIGGAQEKARRHKEADANSWEAVQRRMSSGN
jgi:hypothetical protein